MFNFALNADTAEHLSKKLNQTDYSCCLQLINY